MAYDVLKKEVIGLSDDKLEQLIDFARFLKQSMSESIKRTDSKVENDVHVLTQIESSNVKREIGFMSNDFVSISPDFDICMEGLEEYM